MKKISIVLADDNKLVRSGYKKILHLEDDFEVVGEAKNGREAVAMVHKFRPAIVLMDITMPVLNGLEAMRQVLEVMPSTNVIILSAHSEDVYVEEAIKSGARGYLIKQTSAHNVCWAIREIHNGNTFFSRSIPSRLHKRNRK